ncbi:ATP-binding protein [Microbispora rosea]|uniref:ATP-binding protein n=1 Tax=Microbispora rosea TaxID=58117 RepID=UPI00342578A2
MQLLPDPRALEGLGRNHSLDTALADLVDNSIDAHATHVLIRLVRKEGRLRSLYVVDNGQGMPPSRIDAAMTVGSKRTYAEGDLGHFGIGLQSASFSQARTLTVMTRSVGHDPVGRRLSLDNRDFMAETVPAAFAYQELERDWGIPETGTGTLIRWDDVFGFPVTRDPGRVEEFITSTAQNVQNHLGLVFHRLIERGTVNISLDVEDADLDQPGPLFEVTPLDPFGYKRTGLAGYPKTLAATHGDSDIIFKCHLWPGRSSAAEFRLADAPERRQGLYIYRRSRLLQAGGDWGGITVPTRRLQVARVELHIDGDMESLFRMNPEKSRVIVGPEFMRLAEGAIADDGTTFKTYLEDAERVFRESRKRTRERRPMIPPGRGFAPAVRKSINAEVPFTHENDQPLDIRWKRLNSDEFFEVDREHRTLWLHEAYRSALLGNRRGGLNDVPVVKALLYLLTEEIFQGERIGPKDRDNLELWQEILTAAAKSER